MEGVWSRASSVHLLFISAPNQDQHNLLRQATTNKCCLNLRAAVILVICRDLYTI